MAVVVTIGGAYQGLGGLSRPNFLPYRCQVLASLFTDLLRSTRCLQWRHFCAILCWVSDDCPPNWTVNCHWYAAKEKIAADWTNFLRKSRKDRQRYYSNLLIYLLINQQRWQRNLLGGGLEAGPKMSAPPQARTLHPYKGMSPNPREAPPALDMHLCSFYRPTLLYA